MQPSRLTAAARALRVKHFHKSAPWAKAQVLLVPISSWKGLFYWIPSNSSWTHMAWLGLSWFRGFQLTGASWGTNTGYLHLQMTKHWTSKALQTCWIWPRSKSVEVVVANQMPTGKCQTVGCRWFTTLAVVLICFDVLVLVINPSQFPKANDFL